MEEGQAPVIEAREIESDMPDQLKVRQTTSIIPSPFPPPLVVASLLVVFTLLFFFPFLKDALFVTSTRSPQLQLTLFFLSFRKSPFLFAQAAVFEAAQEAILDNKIDKDVATTLKKKFDAHDTYGGTWHCNVGKNFGCSITHETQYSMFFEINGQHFLMFKSKD